MRQEMKRVVATLALVTLLGAAAATAGEPVTVNPLAKWIPAESMLVIAYDGNNPACSKTALHGILNEPELRAVFQGPVAALKKLLAQEAMKKGELDTDVLMPLLQTKIGLAVVGLAPPPVEMGPPQPELLLIIEVGKADSPAAKAVSVLLEYIKTKAGVPPDVFKPAKVAGVDVQTANINGVPVGYATTQGHFLLGTAGALRKALDANSTKIAGLKEFQRVSAITGGNEVLLVHYAHASLMRTLRLFMPAELRNTLEGPEFGLANVRSVSVSVAPDGKGFRASLFIYSPGERTGLMKLMAGKPLDPAVIKLAPRDAQFFYAASGDFGAFWDFVVSQVAKTPVERRDVENELAKVNQVLGFDLRKDFIDSLGGEVAVFEPPLIAAVKLKNPAKFKACLASLLSVAAKSIPGVGPLRNLELKLSTLEYQKHTITYVDGTGLPMFIQPCYAMVGDYAVFATYPMALKGYLTGMSAAGSLLDNADFKAVRAKIGPGASVIYYADSKAFIGQVYRLSPWVAGLLKAVPPEFQPLCPDPAKLPPSNVITRHLFGCTAGCRPLPDGMLWESYSPIGLPTPPVMREAGGIATTAILAGMLLPALGRARGEARKVRSASNMKQIAKAAQLWLLKHGGNTTYPPSLKALMDKEIIGEPKLFIHPSSSRKPRKGEFYSDYDSILDMVGRQLTEAEAPMNLPLAWEKRNFSGDGRNVVFFDSHVEFMPEPRFRLLMVRVNKFVDDIKKGKKPKWTEDGPAVLRELENF